MKKIIFILITVLFLISCKNKKVLQDQYSEIKIGFSIDTLIVERWSQDCDVFISTAKEHGAEVLIQDAANSVSEQIKQIDYLIDQKVDVLVIIPKEADSLKEVLQKAKSHGIPVVSYDRLIMNSEVDLYVSVDCSKVGALMGQTLLEVQPEGGYWSILGSEHDNNMKLLTKGLHEVLSGTSVTVDVEYFTPDWNYDLAYEKMNWLLDENLVPSAVICGNDSIAENVLRSISEHKLGKNIPVVGQDAEVLACRRIADGIQTGTIYKPITDLAIKAAECACFIAEKKSVMDLAEINSSFDNGLKQVPSILLEPVAVTKNNLSEVVVDSGFHSASEIFR